MAVSFGNIAQCIIPRIKMYMVSGVGHVDIRHRKYTDPGHIPTSVNTQPSLYYIAYTCTKVNERS